MFWSRETQEKKKLAKQRRQEDYDRVYKLHKEAKFLCYIDEVCAEEYEGKMYKKLIGTMASGAGTVSEQYMLYSSRGRLKGMVDVEEFYIGADAVEKLECFDKTVVVYPRQQDLEYQSGDILCKL